MECLNLASSSDRRDQPIAIPVPVEWGLVEGSAAHTDQMHNSRERESPLPRLLKVGVATETFFVEPQEASRLAIADTPLTDSPLDRFP